MAPLGRLVYALLAAFNSSSRNQSSHPSTGGSQYIHSEESVDRQELLHKCFRQSTKDAFQMSRILQEVDVAAQSREGRPFRVLEIGCGAGHTTINLLMDLFGEGTIITAVDTDSKMIEQAISRLHMSKPPQAHKRVEFINQSGESLAETMQDTFDAVWLRFVTVHVPDAETLVQASVACLKPGGTLLIEDTYTPGTSSLCDPPCYAHEFFHKLHSQASQKLGGDLTRGFKIGGYLQTIGVERIQFNTFAPLFDEHGEREEPILVAC